MKTHLINITVHTGGDGNKYALIDCENQGIIYRLAIHSTNYHKLSPTRLIMDHWDCDKFHKDIECFLNPTALGIKVNSNKEDFEYRPINIRSIRSIIEERGLDPITILEDFIHVYDQMNDGLAVNEILKTTMSSELITEITMSDKDLWDITHQVSSGKMVVIQWPSSQAFTGVSYQNLENDGIQLINDREGLEYYGNASYLVPVDKLNKYNLN